MTQTIRLCDNCEASAGPLDLICRQCGKRLPTELPSVEFDLKKWKWFVGLDGRINRGGFLLREIIALISIFVLPLLAYTVLPANNDSIFIGIVVLIISWGGILVGIIIHVSSVVRRFHDRSKSGWMLLLLFVPILNLIKWLELLFMGNNQTSNQYGGLPDGVNVGY
jgi:uncharacterized membrane protein YhaH (DUF805 family)